jgi:hypothetical protein
MSVANVKRACKEGRYDGGGNIGQVVVYSFRYGHLGQLEQNLTGRHMSAAIRIYMDLHLCGSHPPESVRTDLATLSEIAPMYKLELQLRNTFGRKISQSVGPAEPGPEEVLEEVVDLHPLWLLKKNNLRRKQVLNHIGEYFDEASVLRVAKYEPASALFKGIVKRDDHDVLHTYLASRSANQLAKLREHIERHCRRNIPTSAYRAAVNVLEVRMQI